MRLLNYLFVALVLINIGCSKDDDDDVVSAELTDQEKSDLLQLREEEKLARDVYLYAFEKYSLSVSENIANSEQTHMDKVLDLLTQFDLEDPASETKGVFADSELQNLYATLTAQVDRSLLDALIVGAIIEDLDIKDIQEFITRTENESILVVYENLMCGSRNHLRSYYSQIESNGGSYSPQYISQVEFDGIVNSASERCGQ